MAQPTPSPCADHRDVVRELTDGEIVGRIAAGRDLPAEAELCRRLIPRLRLYGLRHLRTDAAVADLVQEVLLVALEAARQGRIDQPDHIGRYALVTCRHVIWRDRRKDRRDAPFDISSIVELALANEVDAPTLASEAARLGACMEALPARAGKVIFMAYHEDRSADEIASRLGLAAGNVRVIRHRALAQLRTCMNGKKEELT
jgi:RNA polymerase sigma-70 factor, ECF subfamily